MGILLGDALSDAGILNKRQIKKHSENKQRYQVEKQAHEKRQKFKYFNGDSAQDYKRLPPAEQHIVDVLVEKFILPVKINPDSVKVRINELKKFQNIHEGEIKWTKAINATIESFENIETAIIIFKPNRKEFQKMLDDKENKLVRFPNFYYVFHPYG